MNAPADETQRLRAALRVAAVVFGTLFVLSLSLVVVDRAEEAGAAAFDGGLLTLVAPPGAANAGEPLVSGGSATPFELAFEADFARLCQAAVDPDVVARPYLVESEVPVSRLTFGADGPISPYDSAVAWPLADAAGERVDAVALVDGRSVPAGVALSFGSLGAADLPAGTWTMGWTCTKGEAGPSQLTRFWRVFIEITPDESDPAGWSWTVANDPRVGASGLDTALPATPSAATVSGRGDFAGLQVTVNQTRNLVRQTVSVSWQGATPTVQQRSRAFMEHYLQIFQCWGDPDGTIPENDGPPPEQCVFGGLLSSGGTDPNLQPPASAVDRAVSTPNSAGYGASSGVVDPETGWKWRPFRTVDGREYDIAYDATFFPGKKNPDGTDAALWFIPDFDRFKTNEIGAAKTNSDGTGTALFEVYTGQEMKALGCGQRVQYDSPDGEPRVPRCWIVVVPRGDRFTENASVSEFTQTDPQERIRSSPLSDEAWQNRIAIPLEFVEVGSACPFGQAQRRIEGNELLLPAIVNWQPVLCGALGLPPYSYAALSDSSARRSIVNPTFGSAGMVVINRPVEPELVDEETNPLVYAPVSASGLVVGFNIDRTLGTAGENVAGMPDLRGTPVQNLNLTPRLVAKLLTQSYTATFNYGGNPNYAWMARNPQSLFRDPDFLQFNPEFELLVAGEARTVATPQVVLTNSDATQLLWDWIFNDAEARTFLEGKGDGFGMQVNPAYSLDPDQNLFGVPFADVDVGLNSFPLAEPYCYEPPPPLGSTVSPPARCSAEGHPFAGSYLAAAVNTARASDQARLAPDPTEPNVLLNYWKRLPPQVIGARSFIAITDTPSAQLSGIQTANLSRSGDDSPQRVFIPANEATMASAVAAMRPGAVPNVLQPSLDLPADAYPLTVVSYAVVAPYTLDDDARAEYSAFIEYAVGDGQQRGDDIGNLPRGYAALPQGLRQQARESAQAIRSMTPPATTTTTTATTTTTTTVPAPPPTVGNSGSFTPPSTGGTSGGQISGGGSGTATATTTTSTTTTTVAPTTTTDETSTTSSSSTVLESTVAPTSVPPELTPGVPIGISRLAIPSMFGALMVAALLALEITKRPRRAGGGSTLLGDE